MAFEPTNVQERIQRQVRATVQALDDLESSLAGIEFTASDEAKREAVLRPFREQIGALTENASGSCKQILNTLTGNVGSAWRVAINGRRDEEPTQERIQSTLTAIRKYLDLLVGHPQFAQGELRRGAEAHFPEIFAKVFDVKELIAEYESALQEDL